MASTKVYLNFVLEQLSFCNGKWTELFTKLFVQY